MLLQSDEDLHTDFVYMWKLSHILLFHLKLFISDDVMTVYNMILFDRALQSAPFTALKGVVVDGRQPPRVSSDFILLSLFCFEIIYGLFNGT